MDFKIIHNKKNNQLAIVLSRKKLKIAKDLIPNIMKVKRDQIMLLKNGKKGII